MIVFHAVKYRNFLATGNAFNEVSLDQFKTTLQTGKNGAGKSTAIDAICYALYGKPLRNINKGGVINSINGKGLLVEIEFTTNNKHYLVRRGMKPNLFDIVCDGVPIATMPSVIEMQDHLEKYILKCNFKAFTQIVILGSSSYVPFMRLTPQVRREILEDVLDIEVFAVMLSLLKTRLSQTKDELAEAQKNFAIVESQHQLARNYTEQWEKSQEQRRGDIQNEIVETEGAILSLDAAIIECEGLALSANTASTKLHDFQDKHTKASKLVSKFRTQLQHLQSSHTFFETNSQCTTCTQVIAEDFKATQIQDINAKVADVSSNLAEVTTIASELEVKIKTAKKAQLDYNNHYSQLCQLKTSRDARKAELARLQNALNDTLKPAPPVVLGDLAAVKQEVDRLLVARGIMEQSHGLLKDNGIRTRIVNQYLPIINKTINKYLAALDFSIQFTLDDQFKETIKSRGRDEFSYENFSDGEKKRIDIAILLAFCHLAQLKNTVSTNLLIFDEIFDSSLDSTGVDDMMTVLGTLQDKNLIVISHRDQISDKFDRNLVVTKERGFSVVKTV